MYARVQSDVLRVLRVLRFPVFQFCTCLSRHVFGVLRVLCLLLGLCVLCALCALYAFSKPYVQHRGPRKRASGQKRTDGRQRNMHPIIITSWDPGLCRAQLAPNATFTPSRLLARGPSLPVSPLFITRPTITIFGTLGSAEPSFCQQPNFRCCVHATRNASLYFSCLTCEFSSHFARYVLVYASSVLFWLPPFLVVTPRLSCHYGTGFYDVACQVYAVYLYEKMAHRLPNDIVGCAPWCGEGIHKILWGSTCQQAVPHYASTAFAMCWHENNGCVG